MLGSAKLQAVSECVLPPLGVCLLLLSLLWVFIHLLVLTGVVALGVVRFCAWTVAESAVLIGDGVVAFFQRPDSSFRGPFLRSAHRKQSLLL